MALFDTVAIRKIVILISQSVQLNLLSMIFRLQARQKIFKKFTFYNGGL